MLAGAVAVAMAPRSRQMFQSRLNKYLMERVIRTPGSKDSIRVMVITPSPVSRKDSFKKAAHCESDERESDVAHKAHIFNEVVGIILSP